MAGKGKMSDKMNPFGKAAKDDKAGKGSGKAKGGKGKMPGKMAPPFGKKG